MAKKVQKKFIAKPDDETLAKYHKAIKNLIQKGREQRFVTHKELLKAMPEIEDNVIILDEIYTLFMDLGIEVMDVKSDAIWGKHGKEEKSEFDLGEDDWMDVDDELAEEAEEERPRGRKRKKKRKRLKKLSRPSKSAPT